MIFMKVIKTTLPGCLLIEPQIFSDHRGWFYESYSKRKLPELDVEFVQDNHSFTKHKGTVRGIHFQKNPSAQGKLVRCIRGAVKDVAVDLRFGSPTYKQWIMVELSAENHKMLFLPRGFGHGFITLTDDVEFLYKADAYYAPADDRSIHWDDPELGIQWGTTNPVLSEKDENAPYLKDSDINFGKCGDELL